MYLYYFNHPSVYEMVSRGFDLLFLTDNEVKSSHVFISHSFIFIKKFFFER